MADGHQWAAWSHTVAVAVGFGKAMGAKGPGVFDLIPERYKTPPRPKTAEEEAAESRIGFAVLESGLSAMSKQWGQ